jgi:hypothetical protein
MGRPAEPRTGGRLAVRDYVIPRKYLEIDDGREAHLIVGQAQGPPIASAIIMVYTTTVLSLDHCANIRKIGGNSKGLRRPQS